MNDYGVRFSPIGSPAIANDTVYIVGTAQFAMSGPATVIAALRANPPMTLSLGGSPSAPLPVPAGAIVRIYNQPLQTPTAGEPADKYFNETAHLDENSGFSLDRNSGSITIVNSQMKDAAATMWTFSARDSRFSLL